jgi:hypothetical protein
MYSFCTGTRVFYQFAIYLLFANYIDKLIYYRVYAYDINRFPAIIYEHYGRIFKFNICANLQPEAPDCPLSGALSCVEQPSTRGTQSDCLTRRSASKPSRCGDPSDPALLKPRGVPGQDSSHRSQPTLRSLLQLNLP